MFPLLASVSLSWQSFKMMKKLLYGPKVHILSSESS